jgi:hypothetical protein
MFFPVEQFIGCFFAEFLECRFRYGSVRVKSVTYDGDILAEKDPVVEDLWREIWQLVDVLLHARDRLM